MESRSVIHFRKMGKFVAYYVVAQVGREEHAGRRYSDCAVGATYAEHTPSRRYGPSRRFASELFGKLAGTRQQELGSDAMRNPSHGPGYAFGYGCVGHVDAYAHRNPRFGNRRFHNDAAGAQPLSVDRYGQPVEPYNLAGRITDFRPFSQKFGFQVFNSVSDIAQRRMRRNSQFDVAPAPSRDESCRTPIDMQPDFAQIRVRNNSRLNHSLNLFSNGVAPQKSFSRSVAKKLWSGFSIVRITKGARLTNTLEPHGIVNERPSRLIL